MLPPKSIVDARWPRSASSPSGRLQPARTWVLDIDGSEDDLLKAMKPKTRYNLRLATQAGRHRAHGLPRLSDLKAFHSLLEMTGERDEFGIHTFSYYEQLWNMFGPGGDNTGHTPGRPPRRSRAERRADWRACWPSGSGKKRSICTAHPTTVGASTCPTICFSGKRSDGPKEHGCTLYDFWGIPDPPSEDGEEGEEGAEVSPINARSGLRGVYWFKRGFGGREIEYPGAYDYVYNPLLYKLWMRWRGANLG